MKEAEAIEVLRKFLESYEHYTITSGCKLLYVEEINALSLAISALKQNEKMREALKKIVNHKCLEWCIDCIETAQQALAKEEE